MKTKYRNEVCDPCVVCHSGPKRAAWGAFSNRSYKLCRKLLEMPSSFVDTFYFIFLKIDACLAGIDQLNEESSSMYSFELARSTALESIVCAESQVVAGIKYYITGFSFFLFSFSFSDEPSRTS